MTDPTDIASLTGKLREAKEQMINEIGKVIVGQKGVIDQLLITLSINASRCSWLRSGGSTL